jgi:hypothetical protein
MTRDDIIRMAREAGFADGAAEIVGLEGFARFAALVAAAEREACAKVADDLQDKASPFTDYVADVGAAIRRRGEL